MVIIRRHQSLIIVIGILLIIAGVIAGNYQAFSAATDAKPIPIQHAAYRIVIPILDADGDPVASAANLDAEYSGDMGAFADLATAEVDTSMSLYGFYTLDLTADEMDYDTIAIQLKTSTSGAKTTMVVINPVEAGTDIPVNATYIGGTSQTGRDIGASVLLSPGTGTGQVSLSSGLITLAPSQNFSTSGSVNSLDVKTGFSLTSPQTFNLTGDITGNLSGSVGSVTGDVTVGAIDAGVITNATFADNAIDEAVFSPDAYADLSATGASTDPWTVVLPGAYGPTTAGGIVGAVSTGVNVSTVSSQAIQAADFSADALAALNVLTADYDAAKTAATQTSVNTVLTRIGDPATEYSGRFGANNLLGRIAAVGAQVLKTQVRGIITLDTSTMGLTVTPDLDSDTARIDMVARWFYQDKDNKLQTAYQQIGDYHRTDGFVLTEDPGAQVTSDGSNYICILPHKSDTTTQPGTGSAWTKVWELGGDGSTGAWGEDTLYTMPLTSGTVVSADALLWNIETAGMSLPTPNLTVALTGAKYPVTFIIPSTSRECITSFVGMSADAPTMITMESWDKQTGMGMWTEFPFSLQTTASAIKAVTDKLDTAMVQDGAVYDFTAAALAAAPTGAGGGLDAAGVRTAIGMASANLDTQLAAIPTEMEMNARTLPAADYVVTTDTIAGAITVGTVTNAVTLAVTPPTAAQTATAVWSAVAADNNTALTMGAKLNSAALSGDPMSATVPGTYAAGSAGYAIGSLPALMLSGVSTGVVTQAITVTGQDITIYRGDAKTLTLNLGTAWPLTGKTATLTVKASKTALDATAIIDRAATVTDATNGIASITLTTTETATIGTYWYDVTVAVTGSETTTPQTAMTGRFNIVQDVNQ